MSDYVNPNLLLNNKDINSSSITWRSPSNIAIVKYWGKYGRQLPRNPSISFTLNNAFTETTLKYSKKESASDKIDLQFYFEEKENPAFAKKILLFLERISDIFPFLKELQLEIRSYNSFPHSAGIASSASSMSALAMCLCSLENDLFNSLNKEADFLQKASYVSRLGSGSACRSVYPKMGFWGESKSLKDSSNLHAIPFVEDLHPVFSNFHDDILIASRAEKSVSSRAGHALMEGNIYADNRYTQANNNIAELLTALKSGDIEAFGEIAESEALTLHALMMTSRPPYILMQPSSLAMIEKVRAFRTASKLPLYFSLDAGPNLHLLYPDSDKNKIQNFIKSELAPLCENNEVIEDFVGNGPTKL